MITKEEFICLLAEKGYTKKDAKIITNDFIETIEECLGNGEEIHFNGFGSFFVKEMKEKRIRTPLGDEKICEAYKLPRFAPSAVLKRIVQEGFVRPR